MKESKPSSSSALVSPEAKLADGVRVWPFAQILAGAEIGAGTTIGHGCFIGERVSIGRGCKLQSHVSLFEGVSLDDEVFVGPHVTFTNVRRPRAFLSRRGEFEKTSVGRGATLGAGAVIRCGTTIGEYAMIGAGAVVTRDVPSFALVVGNPARQRGWVCRCGGQLSLAGSHETVCFECGARYALDERSKTLVSSDPDVRGGVLL